MSEGPRFPRRVLLAIWRALIDGLRRHSVFSSFVGFMAAYTAKSMWYGDFFNPHRHPGIPEVPFLDFLAADLLFFGAVMVAVILLENLHRWLALLTIPVASLIAVLSLANGFWLASTGQQLTASVIRAAVSQHDEAVPIIVRSVEVWGFLLLLGAVAAFVGLPFLFRARWRRELPHARGDRFYGLGLAGFLLLLGGLGLLLQGNPRISGWRLNAANLFVSLVRDLRDPLLRPPSDTLPGAPAAILTADQGPLANPPNVLLFMFEAGSHRASSFGEPKANRTPFLASLAGRGLRASRMRAVLPHTTKSIYSFLCGRYPAMQNATIETSDNFGMRCLPHLLKERGYTSALMQSADGSFEDRPRLAANLGFDDFLAWPQLRSKQIGYLASDDGALIPSVTKWIETRQKPYLMLVVTSLTHHPYLPPGGHPEVLGLGRKERYHWLLGYLDQVLAELVRWLDRTGRLQNTIVVGFGDHGEGFGEHGLYQHDNTFYEEGLRVPFVVYAPGRITRPVVVEENRSLIDLPPTVLDLVGLRYRTGAFDGHSLLRPAPHEPRYFACWYDNACVGQVLGDQKHVLLPSERSWVRYDLGKDPTESKPRLEKREDQAVAEGLARWLAPHRYLPSRARRTDKLLFGHWRCPAGARCKLVE